MNTWLNPRWLLILFWLHTSAFASPTSAPPLTLTIQQQQLMVDGQLQLGITTMMEKALQHGIGIEYSIHIRIIDPQQWFWRNTLSDKQMRIRLAYDSLKQTYLLSNLTLGRITTDRDLARALQSLGHLQSLPIINTTQLIPHHHYRIRLDVVLERESLPNALRLSSLFDTQWQVDLNNQQQDWTYQP